MARICGVCLRPPREGERMGSMRLREGDIEGKDAGLYMACGECIEEHRLRIAEELSVDPLTITNNALC